MFICEGCHLHVNHVGDTPDHHVSDCAALVVLHYVLKRPDRKDCQQFCYSQSQKSPEEILLEVEIWKLSLLNELLSQLSEERLKYQMFFNSEFWSPLLTCIIPERVNRKEGDLLNCVHPYQVEVLPKNLSMENIVYFCIQNSGMQNIVYFCILLRTKLPTCHILDHCSLILPML